MEQRKFRMPTAYTILFCLILLVALSTWLIPAGSYDYADGIPISGSYHAVAAAPQGIGAALKAAFRGFYDAVDVCVFILMVGGFLGVVMKTGAIDAGVSNVISRLQGRENLLITILMLFFGLGGTTYGMWEETMAFFPLLLPIFLAAGYDDPAGGRGRRHRLHGESLRHRHRRRLRRGLSGGGPSLAAHSVRDL